MKRWASTCSSHPRPLHVPLGSGFRPTSLLASAIDDSVSSILTLLWGAGKISMGGVPKPVLKCRFS